MDIVAMVCYHGSLPTQEGCLLARKLGGDQMLTIREERREVSPLDSIEFSVGLWHLEGTGWSFQPLRVFKQMVTGLTERPQREKWTDLPRKDQRITQIAPLTNRSGKQKRRHCIAVPLSTKGGGRHRQGRERAESYDNLETLKGKAVWRSDRVEVALKPNAMYVFVS